MAFRGTTSQIQEIAHEGPVSQLFCIVQFNLYTNTFKHWKPEFCASGAPVDTHPPLFCYKH